jgi:hypothetical protein
LYVVGSFVLFHLAFRPSISSLSWFVILDVFCRSIKKEYILWGDAVCQRNRWQLGLFSFHFGSMSLQANKENLSDTLLIKSSFVNDGAPILLCQANQTPLWVGFGCVEVGASLTREFTLVNPQASRVDVVVTSSFEKMGIRVTLGGFGRTILLQPGESVLGQISWTPQKNCSLRETIELSINTNLTIMILIHGFAGIGATFVCASRHFSSSSSHQFSGTEKNN